MYDFLCRYAYLPLLDQLKSRPVNQFLAELEQNQRLTRVELEALQLDMLHRIVNHAAKNTSFYRQRFEMIGVEPEEVRTMDDFREIPILTKSDVFEQGRMMVSSEYPGELRLATTSGSTGVALEFHYDSNFFARSLACMWRGRRWWGVNRGDRQLILWARPVESNRRSSLAAALKFRLRNALQFDTFEQFNSRKLEEIVGAIRSFRPSIIYGYGSSLGKLATFMADHGIRLEEVERPKILEYTADHMYVRERELAELTFGAPVLSAYGAGESPGVAQQCPEGNMHVSIDHVLIEFLGDDDSPADPGEIANIVVTPLHNKGMPLIRYAVGDRGSFEEGLCPCGNPLPLMNLEIGKAVDLITTSEVDSVSAHVFDYINIYLMRRGIRGVRQFFVEQSSPDTFKLSVVRDRPFEQESVSTFMHKMREKLGESIDVEVEYVEEIPVSSSGKRRYFERSFKE